MKDMNRNCINEMRKIHANQEFVAESVVHFATRNKQINSLFLTLVILPEVLEYPEDD